MLYKQIREPFTVLTRTPNYRKGKWFWSNYLTRFIHANDMLSSCCIPRGLIDYLN